MTEDQKETLNKIDARVSLGALAVLANEFETFAKFTLLSTPQGNPNYAYHKSMALKLWNKINEYIKSIGTVFDNIKE